MIIIGEKINATRTEVRSLIENRDKEKLVELAQKQAVSGARFIDVNVGTGKGTQEDEISAMQWAVNVLKQKIEAGLCIDSADPMVLDAGLSACDNRPVMINSVKAEEECLKEILPLAKKYNALMVALTMDENGIPQTADSRLAACRKIAESCSEHDIPEEKIFFDPLVIPVSTDNRQGMVTLDTLSAIKKEYPKANSVMGISNVSYGLPERPILNAAFLHMAIYAGLDSVIMDPTNEAMAQAVRTGKALVGKDRHFRKYTRALRQKG